MDAASVTPNRLKGLYTMPTKTLSFDGKGINGPDEYRSRLATFANPEAARQYGPLFEAAPDLLEALTNALEWMDNNPPPKPKKNDREAFWQHAIFFREREAVRRAIAKAAEDS